MLNFASRLPFSLEDFFARCSGLISEKELKTLRNVCYKETYLLDYVQGGVLGSWVNFEIALRNELVRARARRKKIDPSRFLRSPDYPQAHISRVAMAAYRSTSPLEAEKILDAQRWSFLDSLSLGHYFDSDSLLIYALKLKIMERWDKIENADKENLFNAAIAN